MLDRLKRFFLEPADGNGAASERDPRVAACALFLEMANVDNAFSSQERDTIITILVDEYGLDRDDADALMAEADRERAESIDLWQFANSINDHYSTEEKLRVVELLWEIIYADGKLDQHEDYLIHKIRRILNLKPSQLKDAKVRVLHRRRTD